MTAEAQGVYRNLLDELWLRDGLLPNDERILSKIGGDAEAWPRVRQAVLARFRESPEGLRNDTHDEVSQGTAEAVERQRQKGRARAEKAARTPAGTFQPHQPEVQPADQPESSHAASRRTSLPDPDPDPSPEQDPEPEPENGPRRRNGAPSPPAGRRPFAVRCRQHPDVDLTDLEQCPRCQLERYGEPGEARALQAELGEALAQESAESGVAYDVLLTRCSLTDHGRVITNLAAASVSWLRNTLGRVAEHKAKRVAAANPERDPKAQRRRDSITAALMAGQPEPALALPERVES
jgi:hypothetical protein